MRCGRRAHASKWSDMKPWKAVLGVGAACAACCAVPLVGSVAALTVGSTALVALGSTLLAFADEFRLPLAGVMLALAATGGGLLWWRLRTLRQAHGRPRCGGECSTESTHCRASGESSSWNGGAVRS